MNAEYKLLKNEYFMFSSASQFLTSLSFFLADRPHVSDSSSCERSQLVSRGSKVGVRQSWQRLAPHRIGVQQNGLITNWYRQWSYRWRSNPDCSLSHHRRSCASRNNGEKELQVRFRLKVVKFKRFSLKVRFKHKVVQVWFYLYTSLTCRFDDFEKIVIEF